MSETRILSKGVPFVVDELTEEEEMKFYAESGKRILQMAKEYWLSTGLFYENEEGKLCLRERSEDGGGDEGNAKG